MTTSDQLTIRKLTGARIRVAAPVFRDVAGMGARYDLVSYDSRTNEFTSRSVHTGLASSIHARVILDGLRDGIITIVRHRDK